MKQIMYTLILLVAVTACSGGSQGGVSITDSVTEVSATLELPLPQVPSTLTTPRARATFLLTHFWDEMDWQDTTRLHSNDFMEQNLANYYNIMSLTDSATASAGVKAMLRRAAVNPRALNRLADISARYLNDHNSPMYRPESYSVIVDALLSRESLDEAMRLRLEHDRTALLANRPGTLAADFTYLTREGRHTRLSASRGRQTILMFYDSDCDVCARIEGWLADSPAINDAIAAGRLQVIAIDIFTAERGRWQEQAATLPAGWTVGYAPNLDADELYFVSSTPSLYLLDPEGRVLVKDADDATIRSWTN